ncbi:hypothetical protein G7009_21170 [Pseudomonas capeferrum]|uniref:hypothetical protein n=1 Tax=Pseudomonas capeferrum TaxID=1495066 RepID=UPI0015E2B356|nr:hypothetical protein [Pseudomonas capeferrum]MBA1204232.1 hypothetical protein [Pseudomonas capeferrum]
MLRFLLLFLLALPTSLAFADTAFPYFAKSINQIHEILGKSPSPKRSDLIQVTTLACNALGQLLEDPKFKEGLQSVAKTSAESDKLRTEMARNPQLFTLAFVPVEEKVFQDAGLDKDLAHDLIHKLSKFQANVGAPIDPGAVSKQVDELKQEFCTSARQLQAINDAEAQQAESAANFKKWMWRLGGATVIVADVGAALTVFTASSVAVPGIGTVQGAILSGAVVAGSTTLGGSMMSWGE